MIDFAARPTPVLREWRGEIPRALRDEYVAFVERTDVCAHRWAPGNLWAGIAVRDLDDDRCEVRALSLWTCAEAAEAAGCGGAEWERYFPEHERWLLSFPTEITHYAWLPSGERLGALAVEVLRAL